SFGSRVVAGKLGFLLNDEMDDFASKPGAPNAYGLIQGPANSIGPGKRPLSSMSPTMILKDGKLLLVLGSPGGSRIISTVANILMGVVDYGLNIQEAVEAARFHNQWMPDELGLEKVGISPDTARLLEQRGYKLNWSQPLRPSRFLAPADILIIKIARTSKRSPIGSSPAASNFIPCIRPCSTSRSGAAP